MAEAHSLRMCFLLFYIIIKGYKAFKKGFSDYIIQIFARRNVFDPVVPEQSLY
jgi:hypothetical protein